jgi:hypothetical protein
MNTSDWDMGLPRQTAQRRHVREGDKGLLPQAFSTIPGTGVTVGRKAEESLAQG